MLLEENLEVSESFVSLTEIQWDPQVNHFQMTCLGYDGLLS